jgi:hypothetical protein
MSIVVTMYGTGDAIDDFTVTLFDGERYSDDPANYYCSNINGLELKDDKWIHAFIVKENKKIKLAKPGEPDFDAIGDLNRYSIRRVIEEIDDKVLTRALKGAKKETLKAVLRNMSKTSARELVENLKSMDTVSSEDVKEARKHVIKTMQHLVDIGEF